MAVKTRFAQYVLTLFILGQLVGVYVSKADDKKYGIYITDMRRVVHKNWIGLPRSVDCTVYWEIYEQGDEEWSPSEVSVFDSYRVLCQKEDRSLNEKKLGNIEGNFYTFSGLKVGVKYNFIVEGYRGGEMVASSDTARVVTGRELRATGSGYIVHWYRWIPINGRIPMSIIGRGYVFDQATKAGKIAFHLIWNFFIVGLIIVIFCFRYLRLSVVFPLKRLLIIPKGFNDIYQQGISKEFQNIVGDWRELVESTNAHMRNGLEKGNQIRLEDIEMENVRFWHSKGAETVRNLLNRLQKFVKYPTSRIVRAGLENHELGGFRWLEVSKEVDRAIENRASSELEQLRRKSHMDWLWNLGTLAPLVGLFGTATGISFAFATLTMLRTDITQTVLVQRLARGIFEALWTTIEGLFVGIILMLLYYYYQNKLNWIYAKWEEIYVHVSEKL